MNKREAREGANVCACGVGVVWEWGSGGGMGEDEGWARGWGGGEWRYWKALAIQLNPPKMRGGTRALA